MFQIDRAILFLSIDHVIRVGDYIGVVVLPAGAGIHVSDVAECYGNHLRVQWNLERIGDRAGQSRLELGVALGVAFDLIQILDGRVFLVLRVQRDYLIGVAAGDVHRTAGVVRDLHLGHPVLGVRVRCLWPVLAVAASVAACVEADGGLFAGFEDLHFDAAADGGLPRARSVGVGSRVVGIFLGVEFFVRVG